MNTEELTMLLTRIQVLDNRQVDALTIEAWEPLMEAVNYDDAVSAVNEHFRTSEKYLLPAHILEGARDARKRRVQSARHTTHEPEWAEAPSGRRYCAVCEVEEDDHARIAQLAASPNACENLGHNYADSGYCVRCARRDDRKTIVRPDGSKVRVAPNEEWMFA